MSPDDGDSSGDDGGRRPRQRADLNGGEGRKNSQSDDDDEKAPGIDLPKINLGSDPDFNVNVTSKR